MSKIEIHKRYIYLRHELHLPPQSIPISSPFCILSLQVPDVNKISSLIHLHLSNFLYFLNNASSILKFAFSLNIPISFVGTVAATVVVVGSIEKYQKIYQLHYQINQSNISLYRKKI